MTYELPELLEKLQRETPGWATDFLILDISNTPTHYRAEKVREYREQRRLGQHPIPREGGILHYMASGDLLMGIEEFRNQYPELLGGGRRGAVDIVKEVALKEDKLVELVVERYLIKPTN